MTLGKRLKKLRKNLNMTQTELAKQLNLSFGTISKYEKDEISIPLDNLLRLAEYFDVSTDYLLGKSNIPKSEDSTTLLDEDFVNLSDISERDKETIMRVIEMAKNNR